MYRIPPLLAAVAVSVTALLVAAPSAPAAQQVISSSGPLTGIYVNDDLGCSVDRMGETQVYGGTDPGSCATLLAAGGHLYGPFSPADSAYTSPSQTSGGTGAPGDPFTVITDVDVGSTGLHIKQTDTYFTDDDFYQSDVVVSNSTGSPQDVTLYHALDCLLRGDDDGYGYYDSSTGSIYCSRGAGDPASGLIGFTPISSGSHHLETGYSAVWSAIDAAGANFANTCDCAPTDLQDNGTGISWSFTVPASGGGTITRSFKTSVTADATDPLTTITSGPTGTIADNEPTFGFASNEQGVSFECGVDANPPTTPCFSPFTTAPLSSGPHVFRVRATDHDGNVGAADSRSFTVNVSPGGGGGGGGGGTTTPPPTGPAPPVAGKSFDAEPVGGKVYFKCKGDKKATRLKDASNLAVGCLIDARKGKIRIISAANGDSTKTKSAVFYEGQFKVREKRSKKPITELALAGKLVGCGHKGKAGRSVSESRRHKRRGRRLWGRGRGRFRTRGRRSSATVRGTTWLVEDRCDGSTLTKVKSGTVTVSDFVKHKKVRVKKGHSYVARKRKKHRR